MLAVPGNCEANLGISLATSLLAAGSPAENCLHWLEIFAMEADASMAQLSA